MPQFGDSMPGVYLFTQHLSILENLQLISVLENLLLSMHFERLRCQGLLYRIYIYLLQHNYSFCYYIAMFRLIFSVSSIFPFVQNHLYIYCSSHSNSLNYFKNVHRYNVYTTRDVEG